MITKRLGLAAVIGWITMTTVSAQTRPDFSGTWEMDTERTRAENRARSGTAGGAMGGGTMSSSGVSGGAMAGTGAPAVTAVRITQTAAALTVEKVSGQVWDKVVHKLDGSESVNVNGRTTMKLKSRWDGARLISEGTSETPLSDGSGSITGTTKEVRWIGKDGTMVIESTRVVQPPPSIQVTNAGKPNVSIQYFNKKK